MTPRRSIRPLVSAGLLILLPTLAAAEVSVQLDHKGRFIRYFYLTHEEVGRGRVIWGQVRAGLAPERMLNVLGDNRGDAAPVIAAHPETGHPWVAWSMREANQFVLGFARWDGSLWTMPRRVVPVPDPLYYDEVDPAIAIEAGGIPLLAWGRSEPVPQVYLSLFLRGTWSPPIRLSDPGVASRRPSIAIEGPQTIIAWETEAGLVAVTYETAALVQSTTNLMDSPIPPGYQPPDPSTGSGGPSHPPSVINKK